MRRSLVIDDFAPDPSEVPWPGEGDPSPFLSFLTLSDSFCNLPVKATADIDRKLVQLDIYLDVETKKP